MMNTQRQRNTLRPLDLLQDSDVREVVFFPFHVSLGKLGDNILQIPVVEALALKYPGKVRVASKTPDVFKQIPGVRCDPDFDIASELGSNQGGKLLIGHLKSTTERDGKGGDFNAVWGSAIGGLVSAGGHLLPYSDEELALYSSKAKQGHQVFSGRHPFCVHPHMTHKGEVTRARLWELGLHTNAYPKVEVSPEQAKAAEKILLDLGMAAKGKGIRLMFNNLRGDDREYLPYNKTFAWVSALSSAGVQVLVNPGRDPSDVEKANQIIEYGRQTSEKPELIFGLDSGLSLPKLYPILSRFDIIHTPDTGFMHAAAAVDGPLVIGGFQNQTDFFTFTPHRINTLGYLTHELSMLQSMTCAMKLMQGKGFQVFNDEGKAVDDARVLRDNLLRLDPVEDFDKLVDKDACLAAYSSLKANVGGDYSRFLGELDPNPMMGYSKLWWLPMQQNPLYRFSVLALSRRELSQQGPNLPTPVDIN